MGDPMDFAETVRRVVSWEGETVHASLRGDESFSLLSFVGELHHVHQDDFPPLPPELAEKIECPGETFAIGDAQLTLLSERFVSAHEVDDGVRLWLVTKDGTLLIGPYVWGK